MKNGRLKHLGVVCLVCLTFASCGLFDIDEMADVATAFHLDRDTVYLQQDERFVFTPHFEPDSIANQQVFYYSLGDTVALMQGDTIVPVAPGWATIMAMSVSSRMEDSCYVCVLPDWVPTEAVYPYETIVYAEVTVNGRPLDDKMQVSALCSDEIRGVGTIVEQHGRRYMLIRVGSTLSNEDDEAEMDEDGPVEVQRERISFQCYDKLTHQLYRATTFIDFDGESHGKPTAPIKLKFEHR